MTPPRRPPPRKPAPSAPPPAPAKAFRLGGPPKGRGERIVIYGEGGIGKTSLAGLAPDPVFLNFDRNPHLPDGARQVLGIDSFADGLAALRELSLWDGVATVVIDTATAAQDLAVEHVCATVPHEKGHKCNSVEDYGYGKGYRHVYEAMMLMLAAADMHAERGRNVVLICHDMAVSVPNPEGEDFLQYQPNLLNNGKTCLVRDRIKGWCDHMLFLKYDVKVSKDGKATGSGSRTIWPQAAATYWAKSRTLREPIVFYEGDDALWTTLFNQE